MHGFLRQNFMQAKYKLLFVEKMNALDKGSNNSHDFFIVLKVLKLLLRFRRKQHDVEA
jgi:hypothetical protein